MKSRQNSNFMLQRLFRGWHAKERIVTPVVTNLITAFLLFVVAVTFKDTLHRLFNPTAEDYPLYCILEPYNPTSLGIVDENKVMVDIYIVNMTDRVLNLSDLDTIINENPDLKGESPSIKISMKSGSIGEIKRIYSDDDFNEQKKAVEQRKGVVAVKLIDSKNATIVVHQIKERAMLRIVVETSEARFISSRANYRSLPVSVDYPGRK